MGFYDIAIHERNNFQDSVAHGEMLIDEILNGSDTLEHSSGSCKNEFEEKASRAKEILDEKKKKWFKKK